MSSSNSTDSSQQQLLYNYVPTEWICITFLSLFGLSTFVHTVQASRFRLWWPFPTVILCGFLELIGWVGRLWSSQNPYIQQPYILQVVTLIIAPTPLVAANFILLGRIIGRLGPQYSRLTPRLYTIIFLFCDIVALIVQGVGGSIASESLGDNSQSEADLGGHIALGGTVFQLVAIIVYCSLAAEFLFRYSRDRPVQRSVPMSEGVFRGKTDKHLNRMLQAMLVMTTFLMIRTIYRVIEFVGGWSGSVISTQWLFDVFDGAMIILAMLTLNVIHPGIYLLDDRPSQAPIPLSLSKSEITVLGDLRKISTLDSLRPVSFDKYIPFAS